MFEGFETTISQAFARRLPPSVPYHLVGLGRSSLAADRAGCRPGHPCRAQRGRDERRFRPPQKCAAPRRQTWVAVAPTRVLVRQPWQSPTASPRPDSRTQTSAHISLRSWWSRGTVQATSCKRPIQSPRRSRAEYRYDSACAASLATGGLRYPSSNRCKAWSSRLPSDTILSGNHDRRT